MVSVRQNARLFSLVLLSLCFSLTSCQLGKKSEIETAYKNCVERTHKNGWNSVKNNESVPKETQEKLKQQLYKLAESSCKVIKSVCEKEPNGSICKNYITEFKSD